MAFFLYTFNLLLKTIVFHFWEADLFKCLKEKLILFFEQNTVLFFGKGLAGCFWSSLLNSLAGILSLVIDHGQLKEVDLDSVAQLQSGSSND